LREFPRLFGPPFNRRALFRKNFTEIVKEHRIAQLGAKQNLCR